MGVYGTVDFFAAAMAMALLAALLAVLAVLVCWFAGLLVCWFAVPANWLCWCASG